MMHFMGLPLDNDCNRINISLTEKKKWELGGQSKSNLIRKLTYKKVKCLKEPRKTKRSYEIFF